MMMNSDVVARITLALEPALKEATIAAVRSEAADPVNFVAAFLAQRAGSPEDSRAHTAGERGADASTGVDGGTLVVKSRLSLNTASLRTTNQGVF